MDNNHMTLELMNAAEKMGIVPVMALCGNNLRMHIPMSRRQWDTSIEELNLSVRAYNGLRRAGADTIGKVSELIMSEKGLGSIRNLGRKSINEIKTALLVYGYNDLNHAEKMAFWSDFVVNYRGIGG